MLLQASEATSVGGLGGVAGSSHKTRSNEASGHSGIEATTTTGSGLRVNQSRGRSGIAGAHTEILPTAPPGISHMAVEVRAGAGSHWGKPREPYRDFRDERMETNTHVSALK